MFCIQCSEVGMAVSQMFSPSLLIISVHHLIIFLFFFEPSYSSRPLSTFKFLSRRSCFFFFRRSRLIWGIAPLTQSSSRLFFRHTGASKSALSSAGKRETKETAETGTRTFDLTHDLENWCSRPLDHCRPTKHLKGGFNPPAQSEVCYQTTALPPCHHGWISKYLLLSNKFFFAYQS